MIDTEELIKQISIKAKNDEESKSIERTSKILGIRQNILKINMEFKYRIESLARIYFALHVKNIHELDSKYSLEIRRYPSYQDIADRIGFLEYNDGTIGLAYKRIEPLEAFVTVRCDIDEFGIAFARRAEYGICNSATIGDASEMMISPYKILPTKFCCINWTYKDTTERWIDTFGSCVSEFVNGFEKFCDEFVSDVERLCK